MMMKMAIKREDSVISIESLDDLPMEQDNDGPIIMCVTCDARESDCMLRPCRHAVYCQFCAYEIMNSKQNKCKLCKVVIQEVYVLENKTSQGEIYILDKLYPKKPETPKQKPAEDKPYEDIKVQATPQKQSSLGNLLDLKNEAEKVVKQNNLSNIKETEDDRNDSMSPYNKK